MSWIDKIKKALCKKIAQGFFIEKKRIFVYNALSSFYVIFQRIRLVLPFYGCKQLVVVVCSL